MERVRREVRLAGGFDEADFARAFASFRQTYNAAPLRAHCSPDVFARACELFARPADAHRHATRLAFEGVPLTAGIVAPGTLVLEGEVDETQMGDW